MHKNAKPYETWLKEAIKKHGNVVDYSGAEEYYVQGAKVKLPLVCKIHGLIWQDRNTHLISKKPCPKCGKISGSEKRRKNTADFIKRAKKIHGDEYDYSLTEYRTTHENLTIICKIHGPFPQKPGNHLHGKGCSKCGDIRGGKKNQLHGLKRDKTFSRNLSNQHIDKIRKAITKPFEYFIHKAKEKHGDKYDYSKSEINYVNNKSKIAIICPYHGEYFQVVVNHLSGAGCYLCGLEKQVKARTMKFDYFESKSNEIHNNYYDYSIAKEDFVDARKKIRIICPEHGLFKQGPYSHIKGTRCPECSKKARLTLRKFARIAKEKHGERYDYSLITKLNKHQKVTIICRDHGPFQQDTNKHIGTEANGCPNCRRSHGENMIALTLEKQKIIFEVEKRFFSCKDRRELPFDFWIPGLALLIEFHGQQHFEAYDRFGGEKALKGVIRRDKIKKNWAKKMGVRLEIVSFEEDPEKKTLSILKKFGNQNASLKLNSILAAEKNIETNLTKAFIKKAKEVHGNRYDYSKTRIKPGIKTVDIICIDHGIFNTGSYNHLKGVNCNKCSGNYMDTEYFISLAKIKYGEKFDYSITEYIKDNINISYICPEHGLRKQKPYVHLNSSHGCSKCAPNYQMDTESFIQKSIEKHGDKFDYSITKYVNAYTKLIIICKEHGQYETISHGHLDSDTGGCIGCARRSVGKSKSKPQIIDGVEYPSLKEAAEHFGINRSAVHARLKTGWTVEKAFKTPLKDTSIEVEGIRYSGLKEASEKFGMPYKSVQRRVKKLGWDIQQALNTPLQSRNVNES